MTSMSRTLDMLRGDAVGRIDDLESAPATLRDLPQGVVIPLAVEVLGLPADQPGNLLDGHVNRAVPDSAEAVEHVDVYLAQIGRGLRQGKRLFELRFCHRFCLSLAWLCFAVGSVYSIHDVYGPVKIQKGNCANVF